MFAKVILEPSAEPLSLSEVKSFLRLDSNSFEDDTSLNQSILVGNHIVAANYTLIGNSVDILGCMALVTLNSGANGTSGTVDVKIQESDNNSTWTDFAGGSFTQITTVNDNAVYEKLYTGVKRYIRAVATVAISASDFSVDVIKNLATNVEDNILTNIIVSARQAAENFIRRPLMTQTWKCIFDETPSKILELEMAAPLQSVSSISYYNSDNVEVAIATTNFIIDTVSEPGRICTKSTFTWPSDPRELAGYQITYVVGYGDAEDVPRRIKEAMLQIIGHMYENRQSQEMPQQALRMLENYKVIRI
jgi:uncharacterized phiE125 gp8 family phage protein